MIPAFAFPPPPAQLPPPCYSTIARRLPPLPKNKSRSSSSSYPAKLYCPSCYVRSEVHANRHEYVLSCSGWCSNDLAVFSLHVFCTKWVRLDDGTWLHFGCAPFVLLVPLFVLGLHRRRFAGLATHILFRIFAFVYRLRIVGSLPFLQQSRPAGFDSPRLRNLTSVASPLSPPAEHPWNPCRWACCPLMLPCSRWDMRGMLKRLSGAPPGLVMFN